jgi:hypothetical protein
MVRHPNVTLWTGTTEALDETAHGPWLDMVAAAALQWDRASTNLAEGPTRSNEGSARSLEAPP